MNYQNIIFNVKTAPLGNISNVEIKDSSSLIKKLTSSPLVFNKDHDILNALESQNSNVKINVKREWVKKKFVDIVKGLESMSVDSSFLGGIGDSEASPQKSMRTIHSQNPLKIDEKVDNSPIKINTKDTIDHQTRNNEEQNEVDPFDLKNFK